MLPRLLVASFASPVWERHPSPALVNTLLSVAGDSLDARTEFAERLRRQVEARYRGSTVETDGARHSLRVRAPGVDVVLPLATLQAACERQPERTAALIGEFVGAVEARLVPRSLEEQVSAARLLWCVRSRRYLDGLARRDELLIQAIGADIVAFVAESLPGQVMRGVPRLQWEAAGLDDAGVRAAADSGTATRFARVLERIAAITRIPADGWRLAGDALYEGSILMVPAILGALVERAGGDLLVGVPDRGVALIIPASLPGAAGFPRRVLHEWRESMNPLSREVLRTDGTTFTTVEHGRRPTSLLPWLND